MQLLAGLVVFATFFMPIRTNTLVVGVGGGLNDLFFHPQNIGAEPGDVVAFQFFTVRFLEHLIHCLILPISLTSSFNRLSPAPAIHYRRDFPLASSWAALDKMVDLPCFSCLPSTTQNLSGFTSRKTSIAKLAWWEWSISMSWMGLSFLCS